MLYICNMNIEAEKIVKAFSQFGANIIAHNKVVGPSTETWSLSPIGTQRIAQILSLEDDIALKLSKHDLTIQNDINGLTIQWSRHDKKVVSFQTSYQSKLSINLGVDSYNKDVILDLAKAPHLLIAGATGQGKSVGLNVIAKTLHEKCVQLIFIDPKRVEFTQYKNLQLNPCTVVTNLAEAVATLDGLVNTMEDRYNLLESASCKDLTSYNAKFKTGVLNEDNGHYELSPIVCIIDEFADLIMQYPGVEKSIVRIAQLARAVGIHLVIATQRPSADVITGLIKANFSARLAYRTGSATDSRIVLDQNGAEKLGGMGDAILKVGIECRRFQTSFIN